MGSASCCSSNDKEEFILKIGDYETEDSSYRKSSTEYNLKSKGQSNTNIIQYKPKFKIQQIDILTDQINDESHGFADKNVNYSSKHSKIYDFNANITNPDSLLKTYFLIDTNIYKSKNKYIETVILSIKSSIEDVPVSNDKKSFFILFYNSCFITIIKEFSMNEVDSMISYIRSFNTESKMRLSEEFKGDIYALNQVIQSLKDENIFIFHFCYSYSSNEEELYNKQEIDISIRNFNLKYELVYFGFINSKCFEKKLESLIPIVVNTIE